MKTFQSIESVQLKNKEKEFTVIVFLALIQSFFAQINKFVNLTFTYILNNMIA